MGGLLLAGVVLLAGCSSGAEPEKSPGAAPAPTGAIPDEPGDSDGTGDLLPVEPGTGTEIVLAPPSTAPAGQELLVPLRVSVALSDDAWTSASIDVTTEGRIAASHDLDMAALVPGRSVEGSLRLQLEPGTSGELSHGVVTLAVELLDGADLADARLTRLQLLADERTLWLGFGGAGDLERARLAALLEAGDISQQEYDEAYAATLEVITGTVEVLE